VVTPLTDDSQTIKGMLDVLDPVIMPATGNRADIGIRRGLNLLEQGAPGKGRLLLIADGVSDRYQSNVRAALANSAYSLSTLVVGTTKGGPIPLAGRGFIRDRGEIVITRSDPASMQAVAEAGGGDSLALTITNADVEALELRSEDADDWQDSEQNLTINRWQDDGYWLLWLALPIALLGWRRGAVLLVLFTVLPLTPRPVQAQSWDSLWQREDQRAPEMIRQNPERAAQKLEDPDLRGSALYRHREYDIAAETFARGDAPAAAYNRANALARAGKLEEAMKAYDQMLEQQPEHEDARFNRDLVKQLLEQQQQQSQSGEQGDESSDQSDQQQNSDQQSSDRQSSDQQSSDSQSGDQNQPGENQSQSESAEDQQQQNGQQSQKDKASKPGEDPQQADGDSGENNEQQQQPQAPAELDTSPLTQGQEQWLRRVPDDPGGLLRRKFLQQFQQRDTQTDEGDTPW